MPSVKLKVNVLGFFGLCFLSRSATLDTIAYIHIMCGLREYEQSLCNTYEQKDKLLNMIY